MIELLSGKHSPPPPRAQTDQCQIEDEEQT